MSPMSHAFTEEQLVERPAAELLGKLGWQAVSAMEEVLGTEGTLGRETQAEVVLHRRARASLKKLNPGLPDKAVASAVAELTRDRSAMSLVAANREVCGLLKDGVKVSVPERHKA
jgi:type I restriction enzyme R subunit